MVPMMVENMFSGQRGQSAGHDSQHQNHSKMWRSYSMANQVREARGEGKWAWGHRVKEG